MGPLIVRILYGATDSVTTRFKRNRERGYILVALTLSAMFLLGMVGLAIDVGRMYIAKNEAQSFVDSMALTAATKLNGDKSGVEAADVAVKSSLSTKLWNLGTTPFSAADTSVEFSSSGAPDNWTNAAGVPVGTPEIPGPSNPVATDRVRVATSVHLPIYFMRLLLASATHTVSASAMAVRSGTSEYAADTNVIPFSPTSHKSINMKIDDPDDPFGFRLGEYYTLRWDNKKTTGCPGDDADVQKYLQDNSSGKWLGSVCQDANTCKVALDGNGLDYGVEVGSLEVPTKEGVAESIVHSSDARVAGDDDQSDSYFGPDGYAANKTGNGRRVVFAPINDGTVTDKGSSSYSVTVGFGAFLLMDSQFGKGAICGQYLGTAVPGQPFSGGVSQGSNPPAGSEVMTLRLVR